MLEASGLVKAYPGVRALDGAGLTARAGTVHALVGENGAGKSTLVGLLTGNAQPDAGELRLAGEPVRFPDPRAALAAGVSAVYQELTVLPAMRVIDNVLLGQEPTRRGLLAGRERRALAREALSRAGEGRISIIGGADIFAAFLPRADAVELTEVHISPEGDVTIPAFTSWEWQEVARSDFEPAGGCPGYSFVRLERLSRD